MSAADIETSNVVQPWTADLLLLAVCFSQTLAGHFSLFARTVGCSPDTSVLLQGLSDARRTPVLLQGLSMLAGYFSLIARTVGCSPDTSVLLQGLSDARRTLQSYSKDCRMLAEHFSLIARTVGCSPNTSVLLQGLRKCRLCP
jgi:hypothetical protein